MAKLWVCFIVICFGITGTIVVKAEYGNYLGCFKDESLSLVLKKTLSVASKYECNVHCSNYHYLAIWSRNCYCFTNQQLSPADSDECDMVCADGSSCGGKYSFRVSVYNVTATSTTTTTTTQATTTTTTAQAETTIPSTANDEEQTSNICIVIGVSSVAVSILVITTVICIVSRRRNSSKTNSESLNTPKNLNTHDNGNDEGMYAEVDEAECNAEVNTMYLQPI